jgi:tetratricopeptide (TPR) repeat protein
VVLACRSYAVSRIVPGLMRSRFHAAVRFGAFALLALAASGCGGGGREDVATDPQARAQQLIEAGNQAYRAGDFDLAARRFGAAAVVNQDDAAAYYGLGMALTRLGRDEEARTAYGRARRLAQEQNLRDMEQAARADSLPHGHP